VQIWCAFFFDQQLMLSVLHDTQHLAGVWLPVDRFHTQQKK